MGQGHINTGGSRSYLYRWVKVISIQGGQGHIYTGGSRSYKYGHGRINTGGQGHMKVISIQVGQGHIYIGA